MSISITIAGIPVVIGGNEAVTEGSATDEWIFGTDGDNSIVALAGNDLILAQDGLDTIEGGDGDDAILAGEGDDVLNGGAGNDALRGDAGADRFVFDPSEGEGDEDTIADFTAEDGDVIALSAAGILRANPELEELTGAALDALDAFSITDANAEEPGDPGAPPVDPGDDDEQEPGDTVINHSGGAITLAGVTFSEDLDSFEELETAGLLEFEGLIEGAGSIEGTEADDVLVGGADSDTLNGMSGDDFLIGDDGQDRFFFDPSNEEEGADVITDFTLPTIFGATGDFIAFDSEDVLAADPDLPAANNGDPDNPDDDETLLTLADFDASGNWTLSSSDDGFVLLTHPNGSIELRGHEGGDDASFENLGEIIEVDGEAFPEDGIPVDAEEPDNGEGDGDIAPAAAAAEPTAADGALGMLAFADLFMA